MRLKVLLTRDSDPLDDDDEPALLSVNQMPSQPPSIKGILHFADFFGLATRKSIKAMAGDYDDEIRRIHADGRVWTAKYNKLLAWGYALWYVLRGPLDGAVQYLMGSFKAK